MLLQDRLTCSTSRSRHLHNHLRPRDTADTTGSNTDHDSDSSYSSDADEGGTVANDELARQAARIAYLERLFILLVSGRDVNQARAGAGDSDGEDEGEDIYDTPAPAKKSCRMAIDHIPWVDSPYQSKQ